MMHAPQPVSIVVTTYNRSRLLRAALDSVVLQHDVPKQVILVNDAGSDVSEIAHCYSDTLDLTLLNHSSNRGMAAARNTGVQAARHELIAFLDDDDEYLEGHIRGLQKVLRDSGSDAVYSDARYEFGRMTATDTWEAWDTEHHVSGEHDLARLLVGNYIPMNAVLQKKELWQAIGGFDESLRLHEDWDYWIRASVNHRFAYVPAVSCMVRKTRNRRRVTMTSNIVQVMNDVQKMYMRYSDLATTLPDVQTRQLERLGVLMARQQNMIMQPERHVPFYWHMLRKRLQSAFHFG